MGTGGKAPAKTTTFFETSCEIEDPRTIHPFAFRTHTHSLGKKLFINDVTLFFTLFQPFDLTSFYIRRITFWPTLPIFSSDVNMNSPKDFLI